MTIIFLLCDRCGKSFATDQIWPQCDTCQRAADPLRVLTCAELHTAYHTARDVVGAM